MRYNYLENGALMGAIGIREEVSGQPIQINFGTYDPITFSAYSYVSYEDVQKLFDDFSIESLSDGESRIQIYKLLKFLREDMIPQDLDERFVTYLKYVCKKLDMVRDFIKMERDKAIAQSLWSAYQLDLCEED